MKTFRFAVVITFALFFCGLAAQAQTAELPIRVHVPFAFQASNVQFPAGDYTVYGSADRLHIVNLETRQRGVFVKTTAVRNAKPANGMLQFVRRGETHILKNVWAPDQQAGFQLASAN